MTAGRHGGWAARAHIVRLAVVGVSAELAAALPLVPPGALLAQDNPVIKAAVQLAAEGRGDSARALVSGVLARSRPGDPSWVEALYWRARFRVSGDSAEQDLRRVAVEYPESKYADKALLQLSQLSFAAGKPAAALELATRVRSDYPGSDVRALAALWAARAAFEVGEPRRACAWLDTAKSEAASDVEFLNRVRFYEARCTASVLASAVAPRDSTAAAPPAPAGPAPTRAPAPAGPAPASPAPAAPPAPASPAAPAGPPPVWEVQVAATRTASQARAVVRRLQRAHRTARIERGADGYFRVRAGRFGSAEAADSAARALRRLVGGAPFAVRLP